MNEKEKRAIIGQSRAVGFKFVRLTEKQKTDIIAKVVAKIIKDQKTKEAIWKLLAFDIYQLLAKPDSIAR